MDDSNFRSIDFTENAWEALYDTVDNQFFLDHDADLIYKTLGRKLKFISFGEYLKRYIYQKAELSEPFEDVPLSLYQQIIKESFAETSTPKSFEPTSAKIGALSKNWLTQQTVNRKVVFLLGFGLSMTPEEVNIFLTKALREQGINPKNPFEVICWYCYKNHYSYLKYEKLLEDFNNAKPLNQSSRNISADMTVSVRNTLASIHDDRTLLSFIAALKSPDNRILSSVTARKHFDELFERAKALTAELYNREESRQAQLEIGEYQEQLLKNNRVSDEERIAMIERKKAQTKVYTSSDITESDLEHIISSAIPTDRHGNLTPGKASKLNAQFAGRRFSRQHISEILAGKSDVTLFDLITLNFFVYSQTLREYPNAKARFMAFLDSTNAILNHCSLGELYITNPYECFVLMCMLSDDPLGTYADVWELSYQ